VDLRCGVEFGVVPGEGDVGGSIVGVFGDTLRGDEGGGIKLEDGTLDTLTGVGGLLDGVDGLVDGPENRAGGGDDGSATVSLSITIGLFW